MKQKAESIVKFRYTLLFFVGVFLVGCSDLEEQPVGELSPTGFFQSVADVQTAVNGTIGNMSHEQFWGRRLSLPLMMRSDMLAKADPNTAQRRIDHDEFTVLEDNGMISAFWPRTYQIIAGANAAIAGAESLNDVSEENLNPVRAQAHFVRAFAYYHLVRLFGDIPYLDAPVTDTEAAGSISKTPVAEVYANIIADLEFGKTWLPDVASSSSYPSKATAAAYLASVYLTMGNFQQAYDEAKFVIDNEGAFNLALADDFQDLFNGAEVQNTRELLFALDYNAFRDGNFGQDYLPALTGIRVNEFAGVGGGWSTAAPELAVYETWDGRDYRKAVSLDTTGIFDGVVEPFVNFPNFHERNVARAYVAKYARFPGAVENQSRNGRASSHNYSFMRYAEVLLTAAEALNEINPGSAEAASYVNRVRARARNGNGSSFPEDVATGMSQDDFRNMVLEERKWELAFEAKRWYDIVRRDLGPAVFGPSGLEDRPNFNIARDYLLPLPVDELQRNPNLEPQNPGY